MPGDALQVAGGPLGRYVRGDMEEPCLAVFFCSRCSVATHWEPLSAPPHAKVGVNAALLDVPLEPDIPVRLIDGASW